MKNSFFAFMFFLFCFTISASAQLSLQEDYFIVSAASNLKIAPVSPINGADLKQTSNTGNLSKWRLMGAGGDKYYIKQLTHGLYISAPAQGANTAGKKLQLVEHNTANSTWRFEDQGNGKYRIKNVGNNLYIANLGNNSESASINQVLSPGAGALWSMVSANGGGITNENISTPGTPVTAIKEYETQWLTKSATVGSANNISQIVSINYGYDVKLVYGKPENGQGANKKYIVLETRGTQGFNPGQVTESGETNEKAKYRGYFIESIKTEAKVVSGSPSLFVSLPPTDSQSGTTGMSQGFSISVSGTVGADSKGPTGGATVTIGYSMEKSSSLNWTDFKIKENSESQRSSHIYQLSMLRTIGGGSKPYDDYKDLKNPNNLGIKPLHILPYKACTNFPLYEWIAFEAPANATGNVTIEIRADFVINHVKWTGAQMVQSPETLTAVKQFTVNLNDVGMMNP